jgi:hypothetical protein
MVRGRAIDQHFAFTDFLQSGDHAQQGRFTTSRRPHEGDELMVPDQQVDAMNHFVGL